ncbi:hypothetical protein ACWCPS_36155 [Streptomyces mauvecolor]
MSAGDAQERGDLAEQLLPVAANLTMLVHGDGGVQDIRHVLADLTPAEKEALLVVLAGLVRVDQPLGKLLGWLDFDENGHLVAPSWEERSTLRDLAEETRDEGTGFELDGFVDEAAVCQYAAGIPVEVTPRERLAAVIKACANGLTYIDLDELHGLKRNSTATFISRTRKTFAGWGMPFPKIERPHEGQVLTDDDVREMREQYAQGGVTDLELSMQYGVTSHTAQQALSGRTHRAAGGPIRPVRANRPREATRVVWAGGQAGYAAAS